MIQPLAVITEGGSTTFTAHLNMDPRADVTLSVTSSDTSAATVSVETLVFTAGNWSTTLTVSVHGVADDVDEGAQDYAISVSFAAGAGSYSSVEPQQLSGQVTDPAVVGVSFTLTPLGGATTLAAIAEGENTTSFTVVLGAQPLSDVVFGRKHGWY